MENIINFIKIFFIVIFTDKVSLKILNKTRNDEFKHIFIAIIITIVDTIIRYKFTFAFSIITLIFLLAFFVLKPAEHSFGYCLVITMVSLSINYILLFIAGGISYIVKFGLHINNKIIEMLIVLLVYALLSITFLKIRKVRKGFSFFNNALIYNFFMISILNISSIIIFSLLLYNNCDKLQLSQIGIGITFFSMTMLINIKKSFELYYKQKLLIKDLDETKEELAKTKEELAKAEKENLEASKRSHSLVHRQKALEFQISELIKNKNSKDINKIKQDVENLSKELYGKEVMTQLSKTNIELIDNMFRYMQFECYKNEIRFDLQICGNIYKMINNVINKETLEILLADHIKNAIIAVKHSENSNKSILVKLGKIGDYYGVCIYDSGIEFKEETLKTLGKKPSSTHLDEGGSGMGFLNTFDTLNKYKASLIIDEIGMPCEENYTKVIMIKFDGKNEFKVNSYRQQKAV